MSCIITRWSVRKIHRKSFKHISKQWMDICIMEIGSCFHAVNIQREWNLSLLCVPCTEKRFSSWPGGKYKTQSLIILNICISHHVDADLLFVNCCNIDFWGTWISMWHVCRHPCINIVWLWQQLFAVLDEKYGQKHAWLVWCTHISDRI